jgi:hypothetical protein
MYNDPEFFPDHIPPSRDSEEYVAWIDIMGIESVMAKYPKVAEVNVGKLHLAVAEYEEEDELTLYPMIDGIYAISDDEDRIFDFSEEIVGRFSQNLISRSGYGLNQGELKFGPLLRCGIAKGDVHHWDDLTETGLSDHENRTALVTGNAVSHAHECETEAPPIGIRVHESASTSGNRINRQWWDKEKRAVFTRRALRKYWRIFDDGCEIPYNEDAIAKHAEKADNYFPFDRQGNPDYRLGNFYDKFEFQ